MKTEYCWLNFQFGISKCSQKSAQNSYSSFPLVLVAIPIARTTTPSNTTENETHKIKSERVLNGFINSTMMAKKVMTHIIKNTNRRANFFIGNTSSIERSTCIQGGHDVLLEYVENTLSSETVFKRIKLTAHLSFHRSTVNRLHGKQRLSTSFARQA